MINDMSRDGNAKCKSVHARATFRFAFAYHASCASHPRDFIARRLHAAQAPPLNDAGDVGFIFVFARAGAWRCMRVHRGAFWLIPDHLLHESRLRFARTRQKRVSHLLPALRASRRSSAAQVRDIAIPSRNRRNIFHFPILRAARIRRGNKRE